MGLQLRTATSGGRRAIGGAVAAVLGALVLALTLSPAASASTWTGLQLKGEAETVSMFGVSCPAASLCVAVGGNNTIASSTNPTGGSESWQVIHGGQGVQPTPGGSIFPGRQIRGVSCPSPQLCVAVTLEGQIYTSTNPTGGAEAWSIADLSVSGPNVHMFDVSCPSPSFCAAAASEGRIVTSANPTGGAASWSVAQLPGPLQLRGISCASTSLCVAVGDDGESIRPSLASEAQVLSSTNPLGGNWQRVPIAAPGSLMGIDCPTPALCLTGTSFGNLLLATNPTGAASAWSMTPGGGTVQITDADCPSEAQCLAVDNNGDVLTSTDPTGGSRAWAFENVIPYPDISATHRTGANHIFGASCPAVSFCAMAVNMGQIFVSEDPFAESAAPVRSVKKKKGKGMGPKRPRTRIALGPPPSTEIDGRKFSARFRFHALNRVQVRGFVCKLNRRPFKRCRSPRDYRVGPGRHVFRVRAIGRTGLRGPSVSRRFRVCRDKPTPMPLPPCWKGLPPPPPGLPR